MNYIKLIFAALKTKGLIENDVKEIKQMDIKSGWKTSEFWGKVALQVGTIWAAVGGFVPPQYAAIVVAAAEIIYGGIRGALKMVQLVQAAKSAPTPTAPAVATPA